MATPILIDAHTHVHFNDFGSETESVIQRALDAGVWMINVGTQSDTSSNGVIIAERYPEGVYAAIGLHPEHTYNHPVTENGKTFMTRAEDFDYEAYKKLAQSPKVVAIGECGLDYYYFTESDDIVAIKVKQRSVFNQQIKLALEMDKVLMIHCRPTKGSMDAYEDILEILKGKMQNGKENIRFQVHCYTGNAEIAEKFVELGGYISLTGIITFDKSGVSKEVVERVPLDHILIETDAPYLTPTPFRGDRNEPRYVKYVAEKIAEIKSASFEEVARVTTENARKLFRI